METVLDKHHRSWLRKNWKPLSGVLLTVGLAGAALALYLIHSSEPARFALATAQANPLIVERLGKPLKKGWFISGEIEESSNSGRAELEIPISGPKGKGILRLKATKEQGFWYMEELMFRDGTGDVDLLKE